MQVKRYEVSTINEALLKIKNDLGPDAVILSTRKIKKGRQDVLEVMAARDEAQVLLTQAAMEPVSSHPLSVPGRPEDAIALFRGELAQMRKAIESLQRQSMLGRELAEMKQTLDAFFDVVGMRKGRAPREVNSALYMHLTGNGFSKASACKILDAVNAKMAGAAPMNEQAAFDLMESCIAGSLPGREVKKGMARIQMFIGPTGVGKTTTLAKLAARYALMKKKKVGLITTDNYRIAAAEQLGTYARIMDLPMEKASSREAFDDAVRRFSDRDVILVDTPGRARPDDGYLKQIPEAIPDQVLETNLLINATGSVDHLENIVTAYSRFRISNLIITKIDESRKFGMLYDIISRTNRPVTYLTCGQNVPQDIEEVTSDKMANLLIGSAATGGIQPVERS